MLLISARKGKKIIFYSRKIQCLSQTQHRSSLRPLNSWATKYRFRCICLLVWVWLVVLVFLAVFEVCILFLIHLTYFLLFLGWFNFHSYSIFLFLFFSEGERTWSVGKEVKRNWEKVERKGI